MTSTKRRTRRSRKRLVPIAALKWLNGEGPDQHGKWFGDCEDAVTRTGRPRPYWWRSRFREICAHYGVKL